MDTFTRLLTVAAGLLLPLDIPTDHVDYIETNHLYDGDGKHHFSQFIFWEWNRRDCRFEVVDWRLAKPGNELVDKTVLLHEGGVRVVRAEWLVESWTQYDAEIEARHTLPQERRRKLVDWRRKR